jgi:Xaa-Pro aminopeptidase
MLPLAWYNFLRQELPQVDWVETHDRIMQIRFQRSQEEAEMLRKGAILADGGFGAAIKMIRPGVSEYEIVAEIEHYARSGGAEAHFTLIGSGKFALGDGNRLPLPYSPSPRRVEDGDSIVMEITPRYEGYWTQLVRTVNVGRPNEDLKKLHQVCRDAIKKGLERFKPGNRVKDIVLAMEAYVTDCGYLFKPPSGHMCGIDGIEARVSRQNEMVLEPRMAVIIHPTVFTLFGEFRWIRMAPSEHRRIAYHREEVKDHESETSIHFCCSIHVGAWHTRPLYLFWPAVPRSSHPAHYSLRRRCHGGYHVQNVSR